MATLGVLMDAHVVVVDWLWSTLGFRSIVGRDESRGDGFVCNHWLGGCWRRGDGSDNRGIDCSRSGTVEAGDVAAECHDSISGLGA